MSLINEALKKAQRLRTEDQAASAAEPGGEGPVAKRGRARSANSMVLLGAGAIVLVVMSVVVTVFLLNRPDTPKPIATAAPSAKATETPPASAPAPIIIAPEIKPVAVAPTEAAPAAAQPANALPATASVANAGATDVPSSSRTATPPATTSPVSNTAAAQPEAKPASAATPPADAVAVTTPPSSPAVAAAPTPAQPAVEAKPDARVAAYVESIRVTGIRSSGNESRVLMNDRVYRVNDIVERNLGLRLTKVDTDSLTFSDANGVAYVKYF